MGCQGCCRCCRRKDSNTSGELEGADGSLVGEQEHGEQEPPIAEDHNEERQEHHYEASVALSPEHHYSR